jgi:hypothetical protein
MRHPLIFVTAAARLFMLVAAVSLSGCAGIGSYSQSLIAARQVMNDTQAEVTLKAVCDLSVGAALRRERREQAALGILCAPPDSKIGDFALEQLLEEATR